MGKKHNGALTNDGALTKGKFKTIDLIWYVIPSIATALTWWFLTKPM